MLDQFARDQQRGSQQVDIGIWACLFRKKWQPRISFGATLIIFIVLGIVFAAISIWMFVLHMRVHEFSVRNYDQNVKCTSVLGTNETCDLEIYVHETVQPPIYFTYELTNFFQNHRRYIQSKSNTQLEGKQISKLEAERYCEPIVRNEDLNTKYAWDGKTLLDPMAIANPCGLIAKSFFNDTYSLFNSTGTQIPINQHGIAWLNDRQGKYRRAPNSSSTQWIDTQNQHFIVWMRTAGTPHFNKLWGKIQQPLREGTYIIKVRNNFNIRLYNGHKNIVLTTTTIFGGKNIYMPVAYVLLAAVCFVICGIFVYKNKMTDGKFGEKRRE